MKKTVYRAELIKAAAEANEGYRGAGGGGDRLLEVGFLYGTAELIVHLTLKEKESYSEVREELARVIDSLAAEGSYPILPANGWKPG